MRSKKRIDQKKHSGGDVFENAASAVDVNELAKKSRYNALLEKIGDGTISERERKELKELSRGGTDSGDPWDSWTVDTQAQCAQALVIKRSTLAMWLQEGAPRLEDHGRRYRYRPLDIAVWDRTRRMDRPAVSTRERKEMAQARKLELDVAQREGSLIDAELMAGQTRELIVQARTLLLAAAGSMCPVCAPEYKSRVCEALNAIVDWGEHRSGDIDQEAGSGDTA